MHICSHATGHYIIKSKSGKQSITFEDNDHFGPTRVDMHTGDLTEIKLPWFWNFYKPWVEAGRPTEGQSTTGRRYIAPLQKAKWP